MCRHENSIFRQISLTKRLVSSYIFYMSSICIVHCIKNIDIFKEIILKVSDFQVDPRKVCNIILLRICVGNRFDQVCSRYVIVNCSFHTCFIQFCVYNCHENKA